MSRVLAVLETWFWRSAKAASCGCDPQIQLRQGSVTSKERAFRKPQRIAAVIPINTNHTSHANVTTILIYFTLLRVALKLLRMNDT